MADSPSKPLAKPHIIFLMASQLRFDTLSVYGNRQCPTPKLALLAKRSTLFGRHFTPAPLGVPARSSLMTGLTPHQHGAIISGWLPAERHLGQIRHDVPLMPQHLIDAGYRVVHVGVEQVRSDPPLTHRLPQVEFLGPTAPAAHHHQLTERGLMLGNLNVLRDPVLEHESGRPVVLSATSARTGLFPLREDLFYDSALADLMIETIKSHPVDDMPLALLGMFWLPHPPLWAPRKWAELLAPDEVELPPTVGRWFPGMPAAELANIPGQLGAHVSMGQWQEAWAVYYGMTAFLDRLIGKVLAALDHAHMLDDSLIIFTSDHGEMLGSHGLFGKMCMYEPAIRTPLIVKAPHQHEPHQTLELSSHLDLTATMLDYAQAPPLPNSPGNSLRPLLEGETRVTNREFVFASYDGNAGRGYAQRMARSRTHKLIYHPDDVAELYNLVDDPRETRNLIGQPGVEALEQDMRDHLNRWLDEQDDPIRRS